MSTATVTRTHMHKHTENGGWNTWRIKTLETVAAESQADFWALAEKGKTFRGLNTSKTFQMSHSAAFKLNFFSRQALEAIRTLPFWLH